MLLQAINAGLHVIAIVLLAGALCSEAFLFRQGMREDDVEKLLMADFLHAFSTIMIFITGAMRIVIFEEVSANYLDNPYFGLKMLVFFVVVLLSLYPTTTFYRWRKAIRQGSPSMISYRQHGAVIWLIRMELCSLLVIPMLVALSRMGS
ncbi:DUF2214 family protein [Aliagarivorans taiwanensis]|uniref:DUF2214 family protein n=1 Tax=Aliagarivorans taiwanensis TaxID=561966 RepID=UPI0003F824BE|nr:DUF2214 family protein [Aliagarivorans taiwanensis]